MITAKKRGINKGDFVLSDGFPAIVIGQANTSTPCLEVWGLHQEMGSAYADKLRKITRADFLVIASSYGHKNINPYSKVSRAALIANPIIS